MAGELRKRRVMLATLARPCRAHQAAVVSIYAIDGMAGVGKTAFASSLKDL